MKKQGLLLFIFILISAKYFNLYPQIFWEWKSGDPGTNTFCFASTSNGILFTGTILGLYMTTDNGITWQLKNHGLQNHQVQALSIDKNDNVYAGTNYGLYISTNLGESWSLLADGLKEFNITALTISEQGNIYAGTANYGIFRLINDNTWLDLSPGLSNKEILCIAIDKDESIYAGTRNGIYKKENNQDWRSCGYDGQIRSIFIADDDNVYFCRYSGLYKSTDNGIRWEVVKSGSYTCITGNNDIIFAAASGEFLYNRFSSYSTDGGENWINMETQDWKFSNVNSNYITKIGDFWVGTEKGPAVFYKSSQKWELLNIMPQHLKCIKETKDGLLFTGGFGVWRSSNYGMSWEEKNYGLLDYHINVIEEYLGDIYCGTNRGLYFSSDSGNNWEARNFYLSDKNINTITINNSGEIFVGTHQGEFLKSNDKGRNWTILQSGISYINDVKIDKNNKIYLTSYSGFYKSDDGMNFRMLDYQSYPSRRITFDENNNIYGIGNSNSIYKSTDEGESWTITYTHPISQLKFIYHDNKGKLYTSFDGVLNSSSDNGTTWQSIPMEGLQIGNIFKPDISNLHIDNLGFLNVISSDQYNNSFLFRSKYSYLYSLQIVIEPKLYLDKGYINKGETINIWGNDFSKSSLVKLGFAGPSGIVIPSVELTTSNTGEFSYNLTTTNFPEGKYYIVANDITANKFLSNISFQIKANFTEYALNILKPAANQIVKSNDKLFISWYDKLVENPLAAMVGISREYHYKVELSSDGGKSWKYLTEIADLAPLNELSFFQTSIILNEIGNNFKVRITDNFNNSRIAISETFSVQSILNDNIQVDLEWDYSFDENIGKPIGVAADGVSRIYLKITNTDNNSLIKKIVVSLEDGINSEPKYLGKVIPASIIDSYSEEANNANQIVAEKTTTNADGNYWFWYVSPDEFISKKDDVEKFNRILTARIRIEFESNNVSEKYKDIEIIRPPLAFIHGFNSDPSKWDDFKFTSNNGTPKLLLDDDRIIYRRALRIDPRAGLLANALNLTAEEISFNRYFPDRILTQIKWARNVGYASNQIFYVGHSMGGSVGREIVKLKLLKDKRTYDKGPIYRLITINTPHLGSPLADIISDNILKYGESKAAVILLGKLLDFDKRNLINNFLIAGYKNNTEAILPTEALLNLCVNNGEKFPKTDIPSHLIGSDIIPGEQNWNDIPAEYWDILHKAQSIIEIFDKIMDLIAVSGTDVEKAYIKEISGLSYIERVLKYIEFAMQGYQTIAFLLDSDAIVSVKSQLANLPRANSNVTIFDKLYHSDPLSSIGVGDTVNYLLNTNSNKFGSIPETGDFTEISRSNALYKPNAIKFSSDQVEVLDPKPGSEFLVNDQLTIRYKINDTTGLIYTKLYFQGRSYISNKQAVFYEFSIPIYSNAIDLQNLEIVAIFEKNDINVLEYKSVEVKINANSNINNLEINPKTFYLHLNQHVFPNYVVLYENFVTEIGKSSPQLTATVSNPSVISFDYASKTFEGIAPGFSKATVSYKGYSTDIYFEVDSIDLTVEVDKQEVNTKIPNNFELSQNYPNPFNPITRINYSLPKEAEVTIKIYNILGEEIKTLVNGFQKTGFYTVETDLGSLASGIYLYQMKAGEFIQNKKMILVK